MFKNINNIFFIGIGGISMSGLAQIMLSRGCLVSGSDRENSQKTKDLKNKGANIHIGHDKKNITNPDLVVYTSAISDDNPEYLRAKELNIPLMDRAEFLGLLMKEYSETIAVSGTHGKTSTTGMISSILLKTRFNPTVLIGGEYDEIGGNIKLGDNKYLLTEACEYKRNFLKFNPTIGVVLNIEEDHLDYYKDIEDINFAFREFGEKLPKTGTLVVNKNNAHLFENLSCNILTFGYDKGSDIYFENLEYTPFPKYTLMYNGKEISEIELSVFGNHNILNSLAAYAVCKSLNINLEMIKSGLSSFKGIKRRYEIKGRYNGALLIDDYAHHPTEISAALETTKKHTSGKIIAAFQPHTYTRTYSLFKEFVNCFDIADEIIVLDIYAAREKDTGIVHSKDLVNKLVEKNLNAVYCESFEKASEIIKNIVKQEDTVITLGAGEAYKIIDILKRD